MRSVLKPWLKQQWRIPTVSSEFLAAMEEVLDLYATAYDPKRSKVNFDESNKQLIKEIRRSLPERPGRLARFDYEHERNFCNTTELSNLPVKPLLFPPT